MLFGVDQSERINMAVFKGFTRFVGADALGRNPNFLLRWLYALRMLLYFFNSAKVVRMLS